MNITDKIINRLKSNNVRYFANDNIAEYITDDELAKLQVELASKFKDVIKTLIIDQDNDPSSMDTADRLAKMYIHEIMSGRYEYKPKATAFPNTGASAYTGMLVVRSELKSMCSHHYQPVTGTAYIGIIPGVKVIGLSKYTRIAQWCARRGTLQEELCSSIADEIANATDSANIGIHIGAEHGCCTNRGIMAHSSLTHTTVLRGVFKSDPSVKKEFFDNIALQKTPGGVYV